MLDSGLSSSHINEIYVTPFVMLFYVFKHDSIVENQVRVNLLHKFIQSGMNTELNGLYLSSIKLDIKLATLKKREMCANINYIRDRYQIPDALFLAFLFNKIECVQVLVAHYWGPPLTLLLCHPNLCLLELVSSLPVLVKYGGIPHGTDLFRQFKTMIQDLKPIVADHHEKLEGDRAFMSAWNYCLEYISK
jgi:hypothetical protein